MIRTVRVGKGVGARQRSSISRQPRRGALKGLNARSAPSRPSGMTPAQARLESRDRWRMGSSASPPFEANVYARYPPEAVYRLSNENY
jgi:hypothetical protein